MQSLSITVRRGARADIPIRIESDAVIFAAITDMTRAAPIQITAPGHGLPTGWRAAVMNARGMIELNTPWNRLQDSALRRVNRLDADTLSLPDINSVGFRPYTDGGQLAYYPPVDLAAYSAATMDVRSAIDSPQLAHYSTIAGTLELDATAAAVWVRLSDADTAALPAGNFLFDIELTALAGGTTAICSAYSTLIVLPEVTYT